jgi:hypothetical protein
MKSATTVTASTLGVYAGLLGAAHGAFEALQGNTAPGGIIINAIGAPCQADAVWHACLPALTLIPNFRATGILAIIVGLSVLIWASAFVQQKCSGPILFLLSIVMLLVGGGFVPAYTGIIAGIAGTRVNAPPARWRIHLSDSARSLLAKVWPWALTTFVIWSLGGWVLGHFFNQTMMSLSFILFFFFDLGLPLLAVWTGFARDM